MTPHEPAQQPRHFDRRIWPRAECVRPFPRHLLRIDTQEPLDAILSDVSQGGVGLTMEGTPPPVGTVLYLELESEIHSPPVQAWVTVMRSEAAAEGGWSVGCEFLHHLSAEELSVTLE